MALRLSGDLGAHHSVRVQSLSADEDHAATRPAAIVVAGCGMGSVQRDLPPEFLVLTVDENRLTLERATLAEACQARDAAAITAAVEDQTRFVLDMLPEVSLIDPNRVVLMASGEAAPVAARLSVPVRGRLLLGDPCIVRWPEGQRATSNPAVVLQNTSGLGRSLPGEDAGSAAPSKAQSDLQSTASTISAPCREQPHPSYPSNFEVTTAVGETSLFDRPAPLIAAAHAAAQAFVANRRDG